MKREEIYLHVEREGDRFIVVDQDGRRVCYVKSINVSAASDDATVVAVEFHDADKSNSIHIG